MFWGVGPSWQLASQGHLLCPHAVRVSHPHVRAGFAHRPVAFTSHLKVRKVKKLHSKHSRHESEPPVSVWSTNGCAAQFAHLRQAYCKLVAQGKKKNTNIQTLALPNGLLDKFFIFLNLDRTHKNGVLFLRLHHNEKIFAKSPLYKIVDGSLQ